MDDEADAFELRRVFDEARNNPDLRSYWYRQHLLGSVIRGERVDDHYVLRERLLAEMEELSDEDEEPVFVTAQPEPPSGSSNRWFGRITGTAVSLAVAALVVINGDLLTGGDDEPGFSGGFAEQRVSDVRLPQTVRTEPVMYDLATPADRNRTDAFIVHHIQQNALNRPGAASLIRFIAFDRKSPRSLSPRAQSSAGADNESRDRSTLSSSEVPVE